MTYKQAKNKLLRLNKKQLDKYGQLFAKLHDQISKNDKETAEALEIALMALFLYCEEKRK